MFSDGNECFDVVQRGELQMKQLLDLAHAAIEARDFTLARLLLSLFDLLKETTPPPRATLRRI